nr:uncharacterized protein LOC109158743 [Ipomoea batatas]
MPVGASAKEVDLLKRSKKKTKRGLAERDGDPMEMEEEAPANPGPNTNTPAKEQTEQANQPSKGPTISFKRALTGMRDREPQEQEPEPSGGAPATADGSTTEIRTGPTWQGGENRAENQGTRRPLGDKYGSWMIAMRKPRNYQNKEDPRKNNGRNTGGRNDNTKGKNGGNHGTNKNKFNKEEFRIWNNSRYGALDNLEDESDEEAQDELNAMERPDGPTGALLSGKGKRPQVQTTEAQLRNDESRRNREGNQTETENHTVVRGYGNGSRVEKTIINEEGSTMEVIHSQTDIGDHHQDPPDDTSLTGTGDMEDPMTDVVFTKGQTSNGSDGVAQ